MTGRELLRSATVALSAAGIGNASREAGWILSAVLGDRPIRTPGGQSGPVSDATQAEFRRLLARRVAGEPLQYVLGSTDFYGLHLEVGPGVLIPRPETERLVDYALEAYPGAGAVCDLCTGSGAIALALAFTWRGRVPVTGVDISPEALAYAERNRAALGIGGVVFLRGDLFEPVPSGSRFSLVTANPPYVAPAEYDALPAEVKAYEPRLALYADCNGLGLLARIARDAISRLEPGGVVLCEIGSEQGEGARALFADAGYTAIDILQDYTGRDRVVRACTRS